MQKDSLGKREQQVEMAHSREWKKAKVKQKHCLQKKSHACASIHQEEGDILPKVLQDKTLFLQLMVKVSTVMTKANLME